MRPGTLTVSSREPRAAHTPCGLRCDPGLNSSVRRGDQRPGRHLPHCATEAARPAWSTDNPLFHLDAEPLELAQVDAYLHPRAGSALNGGQDYIPRPGCGSGTVVNRLRIEDQPQGDLGPVMQREDTAGTERVDGRAPVAPTSSLLGNAAREDSNTAVEGIRMWYLLREPVVQDAAR